jgi:hypothetical protein
VVIDRGAKVSEKSGTAVTIKVTVTVWDKEPLMAVMVSVYVPGGVVAEVHRFNLDDPEPPVMDTGVKLAPTPTGCPVTPSVTVPVNPLAAKADTVKEPQLPSTIVVLAGLAEKLKSGGPCTTKVTAVAATTVPNVPVTVSEYVPGGVVLEVVTFSNDEPEPPAMDVGVKVPEAPAGSPLTLMATMPAKPFNGVLVMV